VETPGTAGTLISRGSAADRAKKARKSVDLKMQMNMYPAPPRKAEVCESAMSGWSDCWKRRQLRWKREREFALKTKKTSKKTVDESSETAKVTLPLITADSQVSEWFYEHRDSECLATASSAGSRQRLARRSKTLKNVGMVRKGTEFFDSLVF
jgi:hypothetical protein